MFIGIFTLANAVTLFGLISSITACFLAVNGNIPFAIYMLFLSCLCDMFDGRIARAERATQLRGNENNPKLLRKIQFNTFYGVQLDSLCDMVSFGVTPCVIAFCAGFNGVLDVIIYCIFVVCGATRLAYFNTLTNENPKKAKLGFRGVPIPMSTFVVTFLFMLNELIPFGAMSWIVKIVYLMLAIAFILNKPVKKPNTRRGAILLAVEVIMLLVLLIAHWSNADTTDENNNNNTSEVVSAEVSQ